MDRSRKFIFMCGFVLVGLRISHQLANVALGGEAALSSSWHSYVPPNVAIDGKASANYYHWTCVSTKFQDNAWWRVDLRGIYIVSTVEFLRRMDCCIPHLWGAEIRVGNSLENNGNNNPICAVINETTDNPVVYSCNQMRGRYVNVFHPGVYKLLQFCEVTVRATAVTVGDNVALAGIATQSGEPASEAGAPHLAIDGDPENTCASVPLQDNPWWRVDLMGIYKVTSVSVIGKDRCLDQLDRAEIRIGFNDDAANPRCAIVSTEEGQLTYTYHCGLMPGRFVHVVLPGLQKNLTICEVQVYGRGYRKTTTLRIRTDFDMSDQVVQQQILSQMESEMKTKGVRDFGLVWRTTFKQKKASSVWPLDDEEEEEEGEDEGFCWSEKQTN